MKDLHEKQDERIWVPKRLCGAETIHGPTLPCQEKNKFYFEVKSLEFGDYFFQQLFYPDTPSWIICKNHYPWLGLLIVQCYSQETEQCGKNCFNPVEYCLNRTHSIAMEPCILLVTNCSRSFHGLIWRFIFLLRIFLLLLPAGELAVLALVKCLFKNHDHLWFFPY